MPKKFLIQHNGCVADITLRRKLTKSQLCSELSKLKLWQHQNCKIRKNCIITRCEVYEKLNTEWETMPISHEEYNINTAKIDMFKTELTGVAVKQQNRNCGNTQTVIERPTKTKYINYVNNDDQ